MIKDAFQLQAGAKFTDLVFTYANGIDLTDDGVFLEAARYTLICFYIGPEQEPPIELQEWFVSVEHTELLYMLNKHGLLDPSLLPAVLALVEKDVAAGERDARDLARFA